MESAVMNGITSGFNNLGHTVNVWLWSLSVVLLLFLLFGTNFGKLLEDLFTYMTAGPMTKAKAKAVAAHVASLSKSAHVAAQTGSGWTSPWTPMHVMVAMPYPPVWGVLVGAIWVFGVLLGIWAVYRGSRGTSPTMLWVPIATGIFVFAVPGVLSPLINTLWGTWGPKVAADIAASIGANASAITNPFWIWGSIWGVSGGAGFSASKILDLVAAPGAVALSGGIVHFLTTSVTGGEGLISGQLSLFRDIADYMYQVFNVGILLMMAVSAVVTIWTLLLVMAGVWLGIAPLWAWIAVLDPWSPDAMWALIGVAARAFALEIGAWVWVAGIAAIDGGSGKGPFGLSTALVGFAPWLSLGWTLIWVVIAWRGFVIPAWLLMRHVRLDLANWWSTTQQNVWTIAGQGGTRATQLGDQAQSTGHRLEQLGVALPGYMGDVVGTAGTMAAEWGAAASTTGTQLAQTAAVQGDRAAWRGAQSGWSASELAGAENARMGATAPKDGSPESPFSHPAGWATQNKNASEPAGSASVAWSKTTHEDVGGMWERWQGQTRSPEHAEKAAAELQKTWAEMGLTEDPVTWRAIHEKTVKAQAVITAQDEVNDQTMDDGTPLSQADPKTVKSWVENRATALTKERLKTDYSDDQWSRRGAMPLVNTEGSQVTVQSRTGRAVPQGVAATLSQPTMHNAPLTRQRYGRTEELKQGVWVVQPSAPQQTPKSS